MATILGKRARASESSQDSPPSSRVKRQARVSPVNDENADPLFIHDGRPDGTSIASAIDVAYAQEIRQLPTPKTPRHRDALSKRVPITPRHRIGPVGKSFAPQTPRSSCTPKKIPTVYNDARQLFTRSADTGPLVGREDERKELRTFIQGGITSRTGRCMYVSGPPGTGKSALVNEVCQAMGSAEGVRTIYINCMSTKCSKDVFAKLTEELLGVDAEPEESGVAQLRALFVPKRNSAGPVYVVTLDEIDHLLTLDSEVLYTIFEWSLCRASRLVVLGIANALDLTDRFLPRLKARNLRPQLLPFLPYTAPQIASVITTKLRSLCTTDAVTGADYVPFVHPTAIQLCSKRIASQTGDLRKAFDIIRRTIDAIETETKQKTQNDITAQALLHTPSKIPLGENPNLRTPPRSAPTLEASLRNLTASTAPRASIAHISRVSAAALSNGTSQRLQTLNLQQKAVLCALVSQQRSSQHAKSSLFSTPRKNCPAPTVRQLYEIYCILCKRENALHPLTGTEFADIISGLETLGLIGEGRSGRGFDVVMRTPSKKRKGVEEDRRIVCFVDEDEIRGCLEGVGREILLALLDSDK